MSSRQINRSGRTMLASGSPDFRRGRTGVHDEELLPRLGVHDLTAGEAATYRRLSSMQHGGAALTPVDQVGPPECEVSGRSV